MNLEDFEASAPSSPTIKEEAFSQEQHQEAVSSGKKLTGRWTKEEHQRFIEGLKKFGKNWKKVEEFVGTRTGAQIRSHAQKFFNRCQKDSLGQFDESKSQGSGQLNDASFKIEKDSESDDEMPFNPLSTSISSHAGKKGKEEGPKTNGSGGPLEKGGESLEKPKKNRKKEVGKQSECSTNASTVSPGFQANPVPLNISETSRRRSSDLAQENQTTKKQAAILTGGKTSCPGFGEMEPHSGRAFEPSCSSQPNPIHLFRTGQRVHGETERSASGQTLSVRMSTEVLLPGEKIKERENLEGKNFEALSSSIMKQINEESILSVSKHLQTIIIKSQTGECTQEETQSTPFNFFKILRFLFNISLILVTWCLFFAISWLNWHLLLSSL